MSRTTMTAAFAVMLAASMPMALAQSGANPAHPSAMTPAPNTGTANGSAANNPGSKGATASPQAAQPAPANKEANKEGANAAVPSRVEPGQMLFSKMSGATVYGTDNKDIGSIDNVVLDQNGRVAAVVIKSGGFLGIGGKTSAVAMKDLKMSTDKNGKPRFTVDMTKQQIQSAQNYNLSPPKTTASGSSAPPAGHPTTSHR